MRKPITTFMNWGTEVIWTQTESHIGKVLYIATGKTVKLPISDNQNDYSTLYALSGDGLLLISDTDNSASIDHNDFVLSFLEGQIFTPNPKMSHSIQATTDMTVIYIVIKS